MKKPWTVAIIQARYGSSRLRGKVMADIAGRPMFWHAWARASAARMVDLAVVATSNTPADDVVAAYCEAQNIPCYRGSEKDVLDRFYFCARHFDAEVVVRMTADCPLADSAVIDEVCEAFLRTGVDYACNCVRYTYPDGLDVEVFSHEALGNAWGNATEPLHREHVTPYIRFGNSFSHYCVEDSQDNSHLRFTVDVAEDLDFVRRVYGFFHPRLDFSYREVLDCLSKHSELTEINKAMVTNEGYYMNIYDNASGAPVQPRSMEQSEVWLARARQVIPGCAQTFSKGYTQHVRGVSPLFLSEGKGSHVRDVDGNDYVDYIQGLLPNILGYANEEVDAAVAGRISRGHSFSLPHPLEVELAERLCRIIPCAEMVRFGKNGSDATAGAVRAARAFTGRERIACCGYHGWQDWYIGSTTRRKGVPGAVQELTDRFAYNDLESLDRCLLAHPGEYAAVIMEPFNFTEPAPGFLEGVRALAHKHGALLIFDEICVGFHFGLGGAQKLFGVIPDLATFGKAMGNGYPISCIVGRRDVMAVFEEIFFSFTFAGEVASMAAAMKVLDILERGGVIERIAANGKRLQDGFNVMAARAGLGSRLCCVGRPSWSLIRFMEDDGGDSALLRTLFQQEMAKRGILIISSHNVCAALTEADIEKTLAVYAEVFKLIRGWVDAGNLELRLEGPIIQPVFKVR